MKEYNFSVFEVRNQKTSPSSCTSTHFQQRHSAFCASPFDHFTLALAAMGPLVPPSLVGPGQRPRFGPDVGRRPKGTDVSSFFAPFRLGGKEVSRARTPTETWFLNKWFFFVFLGSFRTRSATLTAADTTPSTLTETLQNSPEVYGIQKSNKVPAVANC